MNNELDDVHVRADSANDGIEEDEENEMGYALGPRPDTAARQHSDRHQVQDTSEKVNASRREINEFLSQFYLIRTPYGYILGRNSPHVSTRSLARRSSPLASQHKPSYGEFIMSKYSTSHVLWCIHVSVES